VRRLGLRIPNEMINQLRFGRGLDNRKLKAAGYEYRFTTREAVIKQREHMRLLPLLRGAGEPYTYEREVEEFLRWSPSVRRSGASAGKAWRPSPQQVVELQKALSSLGQRSAPSGPAPGRQPEPHAAAHASQAAPVSEYDDLAVPEVIALLPSLERGDLEVLRSHESAQHGRAEVLTAIDRLLMGTHPADAS
jgi:UDP-glucose 4-epimerase